MNGTERFTVDTNILIYASDQTDANKKAVARSLLARMDELDCILPLQCISEFYSATTKKNRLSPQEAERIADQFLHSFDVVASSPEDVQAAIRIHRNYRVQFYDALLWMTARRAGCSIFLTEDGHFGKNFSGITLHNPFAVGFDLASLVS